MLASGVLFSQAVSVQTRQIEAKSPLFKYFRQGDQASQ